MIIFLLKTIKTFYYYNYFSIISYFLTKIINKTLIILNKIQAKNKNIFLFFHQIIQLYDSHLNFPNKIINTRNF